MLDAFPEPLIELDVDNTPEPIKSPTEIVDECPVPGISMNDWHGKHTSSEMMDIQNTYDPRSHEQYGDFCVALDEVVLRETQGQLTSYRAGTLSKGKSKAVRHMYYASIIKILERIAEEPANTIRSKDGSNINVFEALSDEQTGLFSYVPYLMNSFNCLGTCFNKKRQIGFSWYLSMDSYPAIIRHELAHAAVEILKPLKYPDIQAHGPEYKLVGTLLGVTDEELLPISSTKDESYFLFRRMSAQYIVRCQKCNKFNSYYMNYPSSIFHEKTKERKRGCKKICPKCKSNKLGLVHTP